MKDKRQSDTEFLMECKIEVSNEKEIALKVRKQLARYIDKKDEEIFANMKMTEIIDITESLDILDFTLLLEGIFNREVLPEEVNTLLEKQYEEMSVKEYIDKIITLRKWENKDRHVL